MTPPTPRGGLAAEVGKKQPFTSGTQEAHLNIIRTADLLQAGAQRLFRAHGLTRSLYNALRIAAAGGSTGVPVRTIADHMIVREPDISRLVDRLEQAGLVTRHRCTEDRRVVHVRVTPAGRRKARELVDPLAALYDAQLGHLSAKQLDTLNDLMVGARAHACPD
ncbi:MAG: MarR family winged helix-turn-helix transcriptional regulator [Planctomycetota bacterium]|jgi:DNA-binding MarR family transcriptional regulator